MAELKGLLDSAKRKLGGLLGDFPAGFNAGAVAGIAGYPGDIAYMLDTAGRAITGQDTQPAAQDFPGTTDYIAAKSGYPIPGSFSGQLGAAVGGMLTPGPGDLAKFAPVLSAIPFWHGSPHKYDAVDLSKIGTGEGAQAYGWGYYGAENPSVARGYRDALGNQVFNVDGKQVAPNSDEAIIATELEASPIDAVKAKFQKEAEKAQSLADQTGSKKMQAAADNFNRWLSRIDEVAAKQVQIDNTGNLYKGEYRWPDPAKEAATPLTGEDLLQWDRPLSEQPEGVRKALAAIDARKFGYEQKVDPVVRDYVWSNGSKKIGSSTLDEGGGLIPPSATGKDIYTTLEMLTTGSRDASQKLAELGIPGIRYLDGMSRTDGSGTHNLVMFSDEGIKLLERNGKPIEDFAARRAGKAKPYKEAMGMDQASRMARAEEMGFTTDAYHGTADDVTAFDPAKFGSSTGAHSAKQGVWTVSDPKTAGGYAQYAANDAKVKRFIDESDAWQKKGDWDKMDEAVIKAEEQEKANFDNDWLQGQNVMKLKVRGKYLETDMAGAEFVDVEKDIKALINKARREGYDGVRLNNLADDVGLNGRPATHTLTFDPKNIRSVNAKFDPSKRDSANLLAGGAAAAVGLGAMREYNREREVQ